MNKDHQVKMEVMEAQDLKDLEEYQEKAALKACQEHLGQMVVMVTLVCQDSVGLLESLDHRVWMVNQEW